MLVKAIGGVLGGWTTLKGVMAGRTTGLGVPTQGSSGLLRDTKPNSNYTSKSSSTKAYTTCIVGVDGDGVLRGGIKVRQRDAGSRDA